MGLDLSVFKMKKYGEVPFGAMYYQMNDKTKENILNKYDQMLKKEIEYYEKKETKYKGIDIEEEEGKTYLEMMKNQLNKKYQRRKDVVEKYNELYNQLTKEEKEIIKDVQLEEVKYYGKNWDLFHLLNHELSGGLFDHDTQDPIGVFSKEVLKKVYAIESKVQGEEKNEGLEHLKELIDTGDFENYYYFIEAWY